MYHSLDKRIWFKIIFLPLKESLTLFQIAIVIEDNVTKMICKCFNEKL